MSNEILCLYLKDSSFRSAVENQISTRKNIHEKISIQTTTSKKSSYTVFENPGCLRFWVPFV